MKTNFKISMYYDDYITHHENLIAHDLESQSNSIIFYTDKDTLSYLNLNNIKYNIEGNFKEKIKDFLLLKKFVLFSLIIISFCLYLNAYRVQNVIFNIETPINNEIKNRIETSNKKVFFFNFSTLDYQELSKELRSDYSCYEWISVNKNYDVIEVTIIKTGLDNSYVDEVPGNIIALKDATIKSFVVTSGDILIEKNEYVKAGDILIQGSYYDVVTRAKGYVLGHTYETMTYKINKVVNSKESSGNVDSFYRLNIFNYSFDLNSKNNYNEYSESENVLFRIPYLFTIYKVNQYEDKVFIYNNTKDTAVEYGYTLIDEEFNAAKVLEDEKIENCMMLSCTEYEEYYEINYLVKKLESIGKFEEMIQ